MLIFRLVLVFGAKNRCIILRQKTLAKALKKPTSLSYLNFKHEASGKVENVIFKL